MENITEKRERARKRVEEIKGFRIHVFTYIVVNIGLFAIDYFTSPGNYWFYWPLLGWGIGLVMHWFGVYGSRLFWGKDWEERKIKELMDKDDV